MESSFSRAVYTESASERRGVLGVEKRRPQTIARQICLLPLKPYHPDPSLLHPRREPETKWLVPVMVRTIESSPHL